MADSRANESQRPGFMQWFGALMLVTVLSVGAAALASLQLMSTFQRISENQKEAPEKPIPSAFNANDRLRRISPVVTNLAAPPNAWIRMEGAIITDKLTEEEASIVIARIGEDVAAYLRTLTPAQLEGARGLQYLREDLNERALTRSGGKVRELIIETLVVQ